MPQEQVFKQAGEMELPSSMNGLVGSPCWLVLSCKREKKKVVMDIIKAIGHLQMTKFKYLKHFLLFPKNIMHIIIHTFWEKLSLLQRSEAKCIKSFLIIQRWENSYLIPFIHSILMLKILANKIFPFFLYHLPSLMANDTSNRWGSIHLKINKI